MAIETVPKVWGEERILINEPEYAAKILAIKKGAGSSWHRHIKKKETFLFQKGRIIVSIEHTEGSHTEGSFASHLTQIGHKITVYPGWWHQFHALEDSEILEVSTHDDPSDCRRRTQSYASL